MKKLLLLSLAFLFAKGLPKAKALTLALTFSFAFSLVSFAQNIAITDDNGYAADPSAMLDVKSTTKGMLVPRVTTIQRTTISNPANGLLVFDTDLQSFYFNDGTSWINLSSGNASGIWGQSGNKIFLNDTTYTLGIGTHNPAGKLQVKADAANAVTDAIFGVINNNGDTVFAVYPEGVRINVADDANKSASSKSGFAVGGFSLTKGATAEYLRVTPDSVRVYVEESSSNKATGSKGGFAVGGFSLTKGTLTNEYLRVTDDSVRVYIDKDGGTKATGSKGGFAVGGFSLTKALPDDYFNISGADSAEIINPSETRVYWYPTKGAFQAGQVLVESVDSVGTNSWATGYESKSIGNFSQALGYRARAYGYYSTAIGNEANADATSSFAFGDQASALGIGSYAFGSVDRDTLGNTTNSPTTASGNYSFAIGLGAIASSNGSFAIGTNTISSGKNAVAIGSETIAAGTYSTSIGFENNTTGTYSVAIGRSSTASGKDNIALGWNNSVSSYFQAVSGTIYPQSIAIGTSCIATYGTTGIPPMQMASPSGQSIAIGRDCIAKSKRGSVGFPATMYAAAAVAIGREASAEGSDVFAIGAENSATGDYAMSFGHGITCSGDYSIGFALSDQTSTTISNNNTMAIMGGNVGIGTTAAEAPLDVNTNSSGYAIHLEEYSGSEEWQLGVDASGNLDFFDGTIARMTIEDNYGFIGLNTTNPSRDLHIKQRYDLMAIRMENSSNTNYWEIGVGAGANKMIFTYNGTIMSRIDDADGSYDVASDKRLKKDIEPVGHVLDKVIQLKPSKFYLKSSDREEPKSYGFIAQEVEDLFPNLINTFYLPDDPTKYKGLTYDDFAILSIQAIIDLNTKLEEKVKDLNHENQTLKEDYNSLKSEIEAIRSLLEAKAEK